MEVLAEDLLNLAKFIRVSSDKLENATMRHFAKKSIHHFFCKQQSTRPVRIRDVAFSLFLKNEQ